MIKLTEIQSIHEQREQFDAVGVVVEKGVWLEIVDFNPNTEQANVLKRYDVKDIKEENKDEIITYTITCQELDVKEDRRRKEELVKKVINKHNNKLKASFAKCLIDGISLRTVPELKGMIYKLGGTLENGNKKNNK